MKNVDILAASKQAGAGEAFQTLEISSVTEQQDVKALREEFALSVSLVAEQESKVVGHIAFPPVSMSDGTPHPQKVHPSFISPTQFTANIKISK